MSIYHTHVTAADRPSWRAHRQYFRYVLAHKLYVALAGVAIGRAQEYTARQWARALWRLLVHDGSKFRPSEWRPYVASFYGDPVDDVARRQVVADGTIPDPDIAGRDGLVAARIHAVTEIKARANALAAARQREFNLAWLRHQQRNDHHWQHWCLREDSGRLIVLLPPAYVADEMLADWMGAGTKILGWPTLAECVAETIKWYVANARTIQLRTLARERIEETLFALAGRYGLVSLALDLQAQQNARASLTVPSASRMPAFPQ